MNHNRKQREALRLICEALDITASDLAKELKVPISTATFALRINDESLPTIFIKFMHDLPAAEYEKITNFLTKCKNLGEYLENLRIIKNPL